MGNIQITNITPAVSTPAQTDALACEQSSVTKKITSAQIAEANMSTNAEALTGTNTTKHTSPANVKYVLDNTPASATAKGIIEIATDAETLTGTDTERATTPANVKYVLDIKNGYYASPSAVDHGVDNNDLSIKDLINTIGSAERTIICQPGTYTITTALTIPANITLKVLSGAVLTKGGSATLSISGKLDAGLYQIFSGWSAGNIIFGEDGTKEIYPQWWGAKGDGTTDDATAIQAALDAVRSNYNDGITFILPHGVYLISTGLTILSKYNGKFIFDGFLKYSGAGVALTTQSCFYCEIFINKIYSSTTLNWSGSATGFKMNTSNHFNTVKIKQINDFAIGMHLYSAAGGIVINKFYISELYNNKVQVKMEANTDGYISQNLFFDVRFSYDGATILGAGCKMLETIAGGSGVFSNTWYNPHFSASGNIPIAERNVMYYIYEDGNFNHFIRPFFENCKKFYFSANTININFINPGGSFEGESWIIEGWPENAVWTTNYPSYTGQIGQTDNIAVNGDLEAWVGAVPSGWTTSGTVAKDSVDYKIGSASAKISQISYIEQDLLPLAGGGRSVSYKFLSVGLWVRAENAAQLQIKIIEGGGGGATLTKTNRTIGSANVMNRWKWFSYAHKLGDDFTTPFTSLKIRIECLSGFSPTYLHVDGITATLGGSATDYRKPIFDVSPLNIFTSLDATPSVLNQSFFKTNNGGATTITNFDNGIIGQNIKVLIQDANTIIDFTATNLKGNAGVDWSPTNGDWMECVFDGTNWYCSVHDCTV